jgi:hypothetical protein
LLQYKLIFDSHHTIVGTLRSAGSGFAGLTDTKQLPALDFLRSDVLRKTGPWRNTDIMDGTDQVEPVI